MSLLGRFPVLKVNVSHPQHVSAFVETVTTFFVHEKYLDLVLLCKNNIIVRAHKIVLASVSKFLSELILANQDDIVHVTLPEVDHRIMEILVNFLYEGVTTVNPEELSNLKEVISFLKIQLPNAQITTPPVDESSGQSDIEKARKKIILENRPVPSANVADQLETSHSARTGLHVNDNSQIISDDQSSAITNNIPAAVTKEATPCVIMIDDESEKSQDEEEIAADVENTIEGDHTQDSEVDDFQGFGSDSLNDSEKTWQDWVDAINKSIIDDNDIPSTSHGLIMTLKSLSKPSVSKNDRRSKSTDSLSKNKKGKKRKVKSHNSLTMGKENSSTTRENFNKLMISPEKMHQSPPTKCSPDASPILKTAKLNFSLNSQKDLFESKDEPIESVEDQKTENALEPVFLTPISTTQVLSHTLGSDPFPTFSTPTLSSVEPVDIPIKIILPPTLSQNTKKPAAKISNTSKKLIVPQQEKIPVVQFDASLPADLQTRKESPAKIRKTKLPVDITKQSLLNKDQERFLELAYKRDKNPNEDVQLRLSKHLRIPLATVKLWFRKKKLMDTQENLMTLTSENGAVNKFRLDASKNGAATMNSTKESKNIATKLAGADMGSNKLKKMASTEPESPAAKKMKIDTSKDKAAESADSKKLAKRPFSALSKEEIRVLEVAYSRNRFPNRELLVELARQIGKKFGTVESWFINKRAKAKLGENLDEIIQIDDSPTKVSLRGGSRNNKSTLTSRQVARLEAAYRSNKFLSVISQKMIADELCVSKEAVTRWFIDRRAVDREARLEVSQKKHVKSNKPKSSGYAFNREQLDILQDVYQNAGSPDKKVQARIADALGVPQQAVSQWFLSSPERKAALAQDAGSSEILSTADNTIVKTVALVHVNGVNKTEDIEESVSQNESTTETDPLATDHVQIIEHGQDSLHPVQDSDIIMETGVSVLPETYVQDVLHNGTSYQNYHPNSTRNVLGVCETYAFTTTNMDTGETFVTNIPNNSHRSPYQERDIQVPTANNVHTAIVNIENDPLALDIPVPNYVQNGISNVDQGNLSLVVSNKKNNNSRISFNQVENEVYEMEGDCREDGELSSDSVTIMDESLVTHEASTVHDGDITFIPSPLDK